jgi:hypothetical protein
MPDFVVIVLPGSSNAPGFLMRMFLTADQGRSTYFDGKTRIDTRHGFEPVAEVEGVRVYREVRRRMQSPSGGAPDAATTQTQESGPALAMLSEALLLGSPDAVKDVIRRAKGQAQGPSLASLEAYRQASQQFGQEPGLFAFSNPRAILTAIEEAGLGKGDRARLQLFQDLVNPKVFQSMAASLTLHKGTLDYRAQYRLNPGENSPLLGVLPTTPVKIDLLHFAFHDALFAAAISNGEGEKRWTRLLDLADTIAKTTDRGGPLPSAHIAQVEEALGMKIGPDVAGKISDVAVAMASPEYLLKAAKEKRAGPAEAPLVVIVQASGEQSAEALAQELLPRAVGLMTQQKDLKPAEKEVEGQRVYTLGEAPLCYGRHGATLILGFDPALVADSLNSGAKKRGLLAQEKVRAELTRLADAVGLALFKPAALAGSMMEFSRQLDRVAAGQEGPAAGEGGRKEILAQMAKDEPLIIAVTRKPDQLQIEARYLGLRTMVPLLTNLLIQQRMQASAAPIPYKVAPVPPSKRPIPPKER